MPQTLRSRSGVAAISLSLSQGSAVKIIGVDLSRCPSCREGTMIVVGDLPASSNLPRWDSS